MATNIVISNRSALISAYGHCAHSHIESAIFRLMAAYSESGSESELYYLDQLPGNYSVTDPVDPRQNRLAISWILRNAKDSVLIVGDEQIVPIEPHYLPQGVAVPAGRTLVIQQAASRLLSIADKCDPQDLIRQLDRMTGQCHQQAFQSHGKPVLFSC